jgi:uncharacterized protein (TIGR02246 family)
LDRESDRTAERNHVKAPTLLAAAFLLAAPLIAADQGLKTVDQAWIKAAKANDLDAIMALYAPDAVMYPPDTMEAKGSDAIRENYKNFLAAMTIRDAALTDTHYETHGDTSIGRGRYALSLVPKAGGDPVQMEGRFTAVGKKIGGKWLYVVDHASSPLPPPK